VTRIDAEQLHRDAIVIDTMGPDGPSIFTTAILDGVAKLVDDGVPASNVVERWIEMNQDALLAGELPGFWEGWDASGVDVASVTVGAFGETLWSYEGAVREIAMMTRRFDTFDRFVKVTRVADVERAHAEGRHGMILNFQNTLHFGQDLGLLEQFYDLGVRIIQLTYNTRNFVGDGCTERNPAGLSLFGIEVVKKMNELGILIDVSHCSEPTMFDAVDASDRPIAITHAFSKAVSEHDRGKSDDVIRAVGRDGYVGVVLVPFFITKEEKATLDHFLDHVDHIANLIGIDHIGIGTDWGAPMPEPLIVALNEETERLGFRPEHRVDWGATTRGYERFEDWPNLTGALLDRGYTEDEVRGVVGGNFLRLFGEVVG
jgi:membrane dipeptidase